MESVIEELRNLNERFTAYVHRVKQLKNEEDVIALNNAICNLEEDLKRLRTSYECQINHLTTTLNILMDEKRQLEDELLARKENDTHFMDRISIESSKNAKLLLDISALKSDVSEKTNEIAALKLRIKELQISGSDGDSTKLKLTQEIDLLKQKLSLSEDLHTSTANQLQSVSMKLSSQEKFAKERLSRSQHRMQWYISQFAAKDSQIEEARKKEASIPTIIAKLRQKAQDELTRYSQKISDTYKNSIKTLQNQLLLERKENRQLRTKNLESDHQMLNLQQEIAELQSKVHSAARQSELLQSALESLNKENAHLRSSYEEKIQELESTITSSVSKVEYIHSSEDNILKEITRLKTMLEREEERLSLPLPAKKILLADENEKNKKEKCLKTDKIEYDDLYDGEIISRLDFAISPKVNEPLLMTSEVNNLDNSLNTNIEQNNEEFRYDNDNSVDDSIVHTLTDRGVTSSVNNHTTFNLSKSGSNAIGCLQICEIDPNGNYLHLWNSNTSQELDIGLYKIWQKYGQEKINEYTFPPDTRISPRTVFTLWSNNAIIPSTIQNTKNEFRCPNVSKWRHGPNCITILSNAYDEILAWLAPYTRCLTSRAEGIISYKIILQMD
ncbi:unnamed protein product [Heterobilharzia americana]|nr:unnamed protein product [Heterobilharzia americana]